jgi:hypothetical protein
MKTAVEWYDTQLKELDYKLQSELINWTQCKDLMTEARERALGMEKEQQGKFTIDFINWLHLNEYKYNPKAKLYQKHFINETLFFSIDELFIIFKQQEQ